jgi:hypothetical protein
MAALPYNTTSTRFKTFLSANNDICTSPSIDTRPGRIPDDVDTIMSRANQDKIYHPGLKLQCCCGRPECAYLENNNTLLGGIERDLETAARLGQVRALSQCYEVKLGFSSPLLLHLSCSISSRRLWRLPENSSISP